MTKRWNTYPLALVKCDSRSLVPLHFQLSLIWVSNASHKGHSEKCQNRKWEMCEAGLQWSTLGCTQTELVEDCSESVMAGRGKAEIVYNRAWRIYDTHLFKLKRIKCCGFILCWLSFRALGYGGSKAHIIDHLHSLVWNLHVNKSSQHNKTGATREGYNVLLVPRRNGKQQYQRRACRPEKLLWSVDDGLNFQQKERFL